MKVIVTGSLGNISKPLTKELIQRGHTVTVISSNPQKQQDIEALGATAAIGSVEDADFLTKTFTGADAAYVMTPPNFSTTDDPRAYYREMGMQYAKAIRQSGLKRVVHLSTMGAHLDKGTGLLLGAHDVEQVLNQLPDISLTSLRPGYFYYNLYNYVPMIKGAGFIQANYGGEDKIALVSPADIAAVAAEELTTTNEAKKVRYIASDERTVNEIVHLLGTAIGKPDLKWEICSNEQMLDGLQRAGVRPPVAESLVGMYACLHNGAFTEDYEQHKPISLGKVKLEDFLKEFAAAFKQG
ncbi:NAD(P)H-binding protein [Chitinophaga filiformis]|uniref:NmrA family NAD(P)-binding protein n=1 Tax=Chitinophaga filiformis TaxID=104663 RepID=UPI001F3D5612|nr:NAD(P)H-binding protein [Chitinophaga filiformis]MCF6406429.1 NAD(P)H-binding protein [Chitinophaga filiformis]